MTTTILRHAGLPDLMAVLRDQHARRWDVVVPAARLTMTEDGALSVSHDEIIDESGVTPAGVTTVAMTDVAHDQLADKTGIHLDYYRRLVDGHARLLSENVNYWLDPVRNDKSYFVRCLLGNEATPGIARAVLSDRFRPIDNIDVLLATLTGVRGAGVEPSSLAITGSLTDARMSLRIDAPSVTADAGDLVARYRRPGTHDMLGKDAPLVSAGIEVRNSDVGRGAFVVVPRITFLICTNGLTRTTDAQRVVHVGGKREEGVIDWSDETMRRELSLIESKTTDAVRTFLSPGYLEGVVAELRGFTAAIAKPSETVVAVAKKLRYSDADAASILDAFIAGGDDSAFGVAQAFTWVAQSQGVNAAMDMEDDAWRAMELAAAAR